MRITVAAIAVLLVFAVVFTPSSRADAMPAVWIGSTSGAYQIDPGTGGVIATIPTAGPVDALRLDPVSGDVWLLVNNTVLRYKSNLELQAEIPLPTDGTMLAQLLLIDPATSSVWVADPRNVFRFALDGSLLGSWQLPPASMSFMQAMTLAEDDVLWLGGDTGVWKVVDGELVQAFSDAGLSIAGMAFDPSGALWLVGAHGARLYDTAGNLQENVALPAGIDARHVSVDSAGAWITGPFDAARLNATHQLVVTVTPFADVTSPWGFPVVTTDVTGSLPPGHVWMSAADRLRLLAPNGTVSKDIAIPAVGSVRRVVEYRDVASPEIRIDFPPDAAAFNDSRPVIGVSFSDEGSGVDAATLTFTANAARVEFVCDGGDGFANCRPQQELTEGAHSLTVRIADKAGNVSAPAELNLVIDLTPPVSPPVTAIDVRFETGNAILTAPAGSVESGARVTITDTRTGESVTVTAGLDGSFSAQLPGAEGDTFTITVRDAAGNVSTPVERETGVRLPPDPSTVAPPLASTAITPFAQAVEFLYAGSNPVQFDVDAASMDEQRVVVLRGRVIGRDGEPLSGVRVSVHNENAFGYTLTRADGWYDIVANGGGWVTVNFEKGGFLSAQRQTKTPWRDYVVIDDVALVQLDPEVTTVTLSGLTEIAVARGSVVEDEDGTRQATVFVPPSTTATMTLPDGSQQPLDTVSIRATEYTVGPNGPAAMPGDLPPASGYTYAVELSVDEAMAAGAMRVDFSQPLPLYVDNFLEFPVGEVVPLGWYDRERAVWVPADNGKIIAILDIDMNGAAILDVDGSRNPASAEQLDALGITDDERRNLANLYTPGKSLWRVRIDHFTPWDCNWPYGPPVDAEAPPVDEPERFGEDQPDTKGDDCESGCIIEMRRCNLGETIPLTGTPYTLSYRSNRMPGYLADNIIDIPLSGDSVPSSLHAIELVVKVAGRTFRSTFPPSPNQQTRFVWDGMDAYNRRVRGAVSASISVKFVYYLQYFSAPSDFYRSFARFAEIKNGYWPLVGSRYSLNAPFRLSRTYSTTLRSDFPLNRELGGWTLSVQHQYDAAGGALHMGDGTTIDRNALFDGVIKSMAGSVFAGNAGDGGPATLARLRYPFDLVFGADGAMYIADTYNHSIRRVDQNGIITTVAGTGQSGFSGDGGLAAASKLYQPYGIAIGPDRALYIADRYNHRIRRVGKDGIITTVVGNGQSGFSGDGGVATLARLNSPRDIAFGPGGILYIADTGNYRIRQVGPDGYIHTVSDWRGGAYGLAVDSDGDIYVAETSSSRIRRISPQGEITTVAGSGQAGYAGDGGPASEATLRWPEDVNIDSTGSIIISDSHNDRIRRIGQDGIITTVVGNGARGSSADGTAALSARLNFPHGTASKPDGSLYVADVQNHRIRRLRPSVLTDAVSGEFLIAAPDGNVAYIFDSASRHLRTIDVRTALVLSLFEYDSNGLLHSVTDIDGNATIIERDVEGKPVAVVAPGGQRTELALNANGYLETVTHPDDSTNRMTYTNGGLLTGFINRNGLTNTFEYDDTGALTRDINPAGGGWTLVKTNNASGYTVTLESGEGRRTEYGVEPLTTGGRLQITRAADGSLSTTEFRRKDEIETTRADGTHTLVRQTPDPRFGMQAPVRSVVTTLPSGLASNSTAFRSVVLAHPADPFSLSSQIDVVSVNGRAAVTQFKVSTRTAILTTPEDRKSIVQLDVKGKPVLVRNGTLAEAAYTYTTEGRVETVTVGTGAEARTTAFTYYTSGPSKGWLEILTDAENRTVIYEYDLAGRVIRQILPDVREIDYGYDANGNLTSITPPGRPAHNFTFTPVDLEDDYTPPDVLPGIDATDYAYNLDKQLELVTRPDGLAIDFVYGQTTGKLDGIVVPNGTYAFAYKPSSGQLGTLTAPDGGQIDYTYDGFLTTNVTWSGFVSGTVAYSYNPDFRMASVSVNGNAVSFGYDDDGLLTSAGALALDRDAANGLLDTTALGVVMTDNDVNAFGELDVSTASVSGSDIYSIDFERDKLGRITQKTETINGIAIVYGYEYDLAGRLDIIKQDGTVTADYTYDTNGNRTHINGAEVGVYDEQDRLTTYEGCDYVYTGNGELDTYTCGGDVFDVDYDVLGNLRNVVRPDGTEIDYVIDGQNRRIGKKVDGVLVQGFLYQNQLEPVAELDGAGNVVARFVYAERPNTPSYMLKGGNTYRIISDHLGSPRLIIDAATGEIVQRMDYDEWGNVLLDTNPGFQPFGFAGGIYDRDIGLIRFGARDYDPVTGRWTAKDPIGLSGGLNLYQYAAGNPINLVDPTGLESVEHYLNTWLNQAGSLEGALHMATKEKMHPNNQPNDANNRTAAEHYLFGRYMADGAMGADVQAAYFIAGNWISIGYFDAKALGLYPNASPADYTQLGWEQRAWTDSWLNSMGLDGYYNHPCLR